MKNLILARGDMAILDDEDFDRLHEFKWYSKCNSSGIVYAQASVCIYPEWKKLFLHREVMNVEDSRVWIDHIDRNGLNCQKSNLRLCNASQNGANSSKRSNNTSGFKGVYWHHGSWYAAIRVNYKKIYVCGLASAEDAARAYDKMAVEHFGNFANLNFPK
jgi:hypothetical protein